VKVVLSPHLDDAVLSAWSVLAGPGDVHVVNVCSGLPPAGLVLSPWDRLTGAVSSRSRMLERLREDRVALRRAGRQATRLDFPEAQYRDGPLDQHLLCDALANVLKGVAEAWAPAGIGGHDDHLQVRDAAVQICNNGGPPLKLYADIPYAVKYGWPGWVIAAQDDPNLIVEEWWRRFLPGGVELSAEKHALSPTATQDKLHALAAYRTQLPGLNGGPLELLNQPQIIGHEVSWAVAR
jgi:LmbE family N-acetylglucosaminyl deacetylase